MPVKINSFNTEVEQYSFVASYIKDLVQNNNVNEEDIAIIARKHRFLEPVSNILSHENINVNYERKENILENSNIVWLTAYLKLIYNLSESRHGDVDYLLPEILSHEFWQLHPFIIYDISLKAYRQKCYWLEVMKNYKCEVFEDSAVNEDVSEKIQEITAFFIHLASKCKLEPVEVILDYILGNKKVKIDQFNITEIISSENYFDE